MPFGKYKGWLLEHIPESYLLYVLDHFERLVPTLRAAIEERLKYPSWQYIGGDWYCTMMRRTTPGPAGDGERKLIEVGYDVLRDLARLPPRHRPPQEYVPPVTLWQRPQR